MIRARRWRAGGAVSLLAGVLLMLTGCNAAATPAPTAVRSTDLAGSESGFDEHAVLGIVTDMAAASAGPSVSEPQTAGPSFGNTLASRLKRDGYRPVARTTNGPSATAPAEAMRALVKSGAKLVVVDADGSAALSAATQAAHDAGAIVIAVGADRTSGSSAAQSPATVSDYRISDAGTIAVRVERAARVIDALQRGKRPASGDIVD